MSGTRLGSLLLFPLLCNVLLGSADLPTFGLDAGGAFVVVDASWPYVGRVHSLLTLHAARIALKKDINICVYIYVCLYLHPLPATPSPESALDGMGLKTALTWMGAKIY